ncbi:MAG: hypothetical protein IKZ49_04675 [Alphaproteobacteria bacterium]|nr:hypothetical protein [Alphaproteobacteria bacterium]
MEQPRYKSYHLEKPTIHKINIWNYEATHCFLYMSCDICKNKNKCLHIKHKSEICVVAPKIDKLLSNFCVARVSGFTSDEFYIDKKYIKHSHIERFKETAKFLRMKYIVDDNVRK